MRKELLLAAAFTGLISVANATESTKTASVKEVQGECHGINACKGQGECGGKGHECAGKNECKGKGWLKKTEKECKDLKGTFKKA